MRAWMVMLGVWAGCTPGEKPAETDTGGTSSDPEAETTPAATGPDEDGDGVPAPSDCDDQDPAIHPGALERCDGIDNDCDLAVDDQAAATRVDGATVTNHPTLDGAFAEPGPGTVVDVCPGVWPLSETVTLVDGDLTVRGVAGRDATVIERLPYGTAFRLVGATALTLDGLTLTRGAVAVRVEGTSTLALSDSRLTENTGAMMIGGDAPTVTIERTELVGNDAGNGSGGAIQAWGTFALTVTDSDLSGNRAWLGGALAVLNIDGGDKTVTLERTTLSGNSAARDGGAMFVEVATLDLVQTTVSGNHAAGGGGGMVAYGSDVVGDGASSFLGNTAGYGGGGGIRAYRSSIADVAVSGNDAPAGGGVAVAFTSALSTRPETALTGVGVDGNTGDLGAGILVERGEALTLDGTSSVTGNVARTAGGGAWIEAGGSLRSVSADWGSADPGTDNAPEDVATEGGGAYSYGALADFACEGTSGCR